MEEKEKEECTGRDRRGAHARSVTLSERVSLAHTRAGSSGTRTLPSAAEKLMRLSPRPGPLASGGAFDPPSVEPAESCARRSGPRERRPPTLSAASTTIAAADLSEAPRA